MIVKRRTAAAAAVCAVLGVGATPALAAAASWHGKLDRYTSKLHFTVKRSKIVNFTIPEAPAYCLTGFAAVTIHIPSARIRGGRFSRTLNLTYDGETESIKLTGRLRGGTAKGAIHMHGPCDGSFTWTAHGG